MYRGVPEVDAQEGWLSGTHKLIQGMLCGLNLNIPVFNDEQLVGPFLDSCAA